MSLHSEIHVGYEIGTGRAVAIPLRHLAVTGQTQESGKTTTLEGLISRSGARAIAYVTKRGESSFHVANPIPPYFQERADWQFVQSLLEAAMSTKMDFKQPWIMRVSDGAKTLEDVRANLRRFIHGVADTRPASTKKKKSDDEPKKRWLQKPATGLSADVYYVLDKYFDDVMPQIQNLPYSTSLELAPGLNVMDLRDYDFAVQALVVRSVTDRIRQHEEKTVNIIPEAWKFAPKQRGSPVRLAAEEYVRESAAMKNFLWVDSQDLAGVADVIMRQVGVWIFGVQRAKHEIERALDHMPEGLPSRRPRPADIATLGKGQFYVCFGREMYKVYVQPAWMAAAHAEAIARGEEDVESAREILKDFDKSSAAVARPAPLARAKGAAATGATAADPDSEVFDGQSVGSSSAAQRQNRKAAPPRAEEVITGDVHDLRGRQAAEGIGDRSAPGGKAQRNDSSAVHKAEEEAVWKEKYEALTTQLHDLLGFPPAYQPPAEELISTVRALRDAHDAMAKKPAHSASNGVGAVDLEKIFAYVKQRAANDPGILQLLTSAPELRVKCERRLLEMNDTGTPGRIGLLIADKFFDQPKNSGDVTKEFKRRGWFSVKTSNAAVLRPLADIAEMGFLTRDGSSYQAVPGMKVNIVEA